MHAVSCESLRHRYGDRVALDGVGFEVPKGALFGLVGPNGGGKSTTFQILATLLRPESGTVRLFGEDALAHPARVRRRLGVIFQSPALDKKLTVEENLRHQGYLYGLSGAALSKKIEALLSELSLGDRKRDRSETLSGGLKRRLEVAKGLLHAPELLILDEPTTALDPLARRELWSHLTRLAKERGITILLTTHLLEEAEGCDSVAFLDRGKLVALGSPSELRAKVGAEIISIRTKEAATLSREISARYQVETKVVEDQVRIARDAGSDLISELLRSFRGNIESLTVGKPTLEDFFISATGRRYESVGGPP
jgi:ABC-2 type transport system ATP-binding protein